MIEAIARKLGKFFYGILEEIHVDGNLKNFRETLEKLFSEIKKIELPEKYKQHENLRDFQFSSKLNKKLVTRSKCPIHKFFPAWCSMGCIGFMESFVKEFNEKIKVKRVGRQPENEFCEFEFEI